MLRFAAPTSLKGRERWIATTLETAAAKYSYLRGLVGIPAGLALIAAALGNAAIGPFAHDWFFVLVIVALGLIGLPSSATTTTTTGG